MWRKVISSTGCFRFFCCCQKQKKLHLNSTECNMKTSPTCLLLNLKGQIRVSLHSFHSNAGFPVLVGGRSVTQVITHYNMSPVFLFPPLGTIGKFSLPVRLSWEPRAAGFSQWDGFPVLWWEGRQRRRANVAVYFHSVMCVNLITGR